MALSAIPTGIGAGRTQLSAALVFPYASWPFSLLTRSGLRPLCLASKAFPTHSFSALAPVTRPWLSGVVAILCVVALCGHCNLFQTQVTPDRARALPGAQRLPWGPIFWYMAWDQTPNLVTPNNDWVVVCKADQSQRIPVGGNLSSVTSPDCNETADAVVNWITPFPEDKGCLSNLDSQTCSIFLTYPEPIYHNPEIYNDSTNSTDPVRDDAFSSSSAAWPQCLFADKFSLSAISEDAQIVGLSLTTYQWLTDPSTVCHFWACKTTPPPTPPRFLSTLFLHLAFSWCSFPQIMAYPIIPLSSTQFGPTSLFSSYDCSLCVSFFLKGWLCSWRS